MAGSLDGIRVVELGQVFAGPFAGAILADLGASVIKVERTDGGDDARRMGKAFRHDDALNFHIFNRGKQSVALDLKRAGDRAALERLVGAADVFVHNLRPDVPEALGLSPAALCARHPRLIYCEISAFGAVGPLRLRPGYEPLVQAYSGLFSINGGPDQPPLRAGAALCDQGSGMWAVIGILSLLHRRQTSGRGGVVTTSLLETAMMWAVQAVESYANEGKVQERNATGHPAFFPYEAFPTADGALLICAGNDRLFAKLAATLGRPDWPADPRYADNRARVAHRATLGLELSAILRTAPRDAWAAKLEAAGVPCSPIHSIPEALAQPQVAALGMRQTVPGQDFALTALPLSLDGVRPAIRSAAPLLGEHTEAVLAAQLATS